VIDAESIGAEEAFHLIGAGDEVIEHAGMGLPVQVVDPGGVVEVEDHELSRLLQRPSKMPDAAFLVIEMWEHVVADDDVVRALRKAIFFDPAADETHVVILEGLQSASVDHGLADIAGQDVTMPTDFR